jgi:uncharacterized membrane protein YfcA
MNAELISIGLLVGFLIGLTGVGGASIMTPVLVALRVDPLVAVGSDLAVNVVTKSYGAFLHYRQGTIDFKLVKTLCLGGLPGVIVGIAGLVYLRHTFALSIVELWVRHAIGVMVVIAAGLIVYSRIAPQRTAVDTDWNPARRKRVIAIGWFVGVVVTATSIGAGSVTLPLLLMVTPYITTADLVGSDIMFAAILVPIAAAAHWRMGNVDPLLSLNLVAGCIPGVFVGSRLCRSWNKTWLRPAVAVVLAYAGLRLILV